MQRRGKEKKAHKHLIDSVFTVALSNPLVSERIPFTEALLCVKNIEYFYCMAHYRYYTKTMFNFMKQYQEECHRHNNAFSSFFASQATNTLSKTLGKEPNLDIQQKIRL